MSKTKGRVKAPSYHVPATTPECNRMVEQLGEAQRERSAIETDMNEAIAQVRQRYENRATDNAGRIKELIQGIHAFAEAHRDELTRDRKVKFHDFPAGRITWRNLPPKVKLTKVDAVLKTLKTLGLDRFVRTKEEVDKEAMLREPEVAVKVAGVAIGSAGEDFAITPAATDLEEVTT